MFDRLQKKWKVGLGQLVLILLTFAIGGSLTGYAGKKIMNQLSISQDWLWAIIYILLITILWPLAVLLISVPFGQFPFFRKYIRKIGNKLGFTGSEELLPITHVAIFASGTGSNAAKIIEKFSGHPRIRIGLIVCNNPAAKVLLIAKDKGIPSLLIEKEQFFRGDGYLPDLEKQQIRFIVLAGFLWKIPDALLKAYPFRIVNIHPALLPKYGGKGMYGAKVHQAVIDHHDTETGITIHYVDEKYDNGDIIFQAKCPVKENDTAASLAERVAVLEHKYYPEIIESILVA